MQRTEEVVPEREGGGEGGVLKMRVLGLGWPLGQG